MNHRRKYQLNEDFFKEIDTAEKAYVLGWVVSDGYVYNNDGAGKYSIRISLQEKDKDVLVLINSLLESDSPIKRIEYIKKGQENWSNQYYVEYNSKSLVKDLQKIGVNQNKSKTIKFPKIPDKMLEFFFRGVFEGDGCFSFSNKKYLISQFFVCSASKLFLDEFDAILKKKTGINTSKNKNKWEVWYARVSGNKQVIKTMSFLYKNRTDLRLNRKYNKWKAFAEEYETRERNRKKTKLCKIKKCNKKVHAHGYCNTHSWNFWKYGNPFGKNK